MKIAIAATSSETEAQVSMHGARTAYSLFYDNESGLIEAFSDHVSQAEGGAGAQAAAFLSSRGVDKVVAGDFGPKFRAELESGDIACVEKTGTVSEVVAELRD